MIYTTRNRKKVVISIPSSYKNILVALSGGADSAILLYLIAKEIRDKKLDCKVSAFTIPRPDNGAAYSPKIAEFIRNKLGVVIDGPHIKGDGNVDHKEVVSVAIKDILATGIYDHIYVAENIAQPELCLAEPPVRSPHQFAWKSITMPFFPLDKSEILEFYYNEGVEEMLMLSHSCTTNTIGRCGWCYNCVERKLGFQQLGKEDPGIA